MPLLQEPSRKSRLTSSDTTGFVQWSYTCLTFHSEVLKSSEWRSWDPNQVPNQPATEFQTCQKNNDLLPSCANLFKTPQVLQVSAPQYSLYKWYADWAPEYVLLPFQRHPAGVDWQVVISPSHFWYSPLLPQCYPQEVVKNDLSAVLWNKRYNCSF